MNFTEFSFWPRLLICLSVIFLIKKTFFNSDSPRSQIFDKISLAATSLYLLSCVDALTFFIFLSLTSLSFLGIYIAAVVPQEKRRLFLCFYIPLLLFPLIYYKYKTFFLEQVIGWEKLTLTSLAIPAGISFYTFQKIAILVDACRIPKYRPKLLDFINFASFFPQVVAGPIERRENLMPQMENYRFQILFKNLELGIPYIALGLFYKLCIADNFSTFIDREASQSAWPILFCTFLFGQKIYFDFCGYSLVALGLARCIGISLTMNFRSPYLSGNIRDFWRRWHISLSYWFKDYIYIPLGGGKVPHWWLNLFLIFLISGLWHGAGWGFILWGALHGIYSIVSHFLKDRIRLPWLFSWPITMAAVFLAWLPFYETRWPVLLEKFAIITSPSAYSATALHNFLTRYEGGDAITLSALLLLSSCVFLLEGLSRLKKREDYHFAHSPVATFLLVAAIILIGSTNGNSFIYFSF